MVTGPAQTLRGLGKPGAADPDLAQLVPGANSQWASFSPMLPFLHKQPPACRLRGPRWGKLPGGGLPRSAKLGHALPKTGSIPLKDHGLLHIQVESMIRSQDWGIEGGGCERDSQKDPFPSGPLTSWGPAGHWFPICPGEWNFFLLGCLIAIAGFPSLALLQK